MSVTIPKQFIDAQTLLETSFRLGVQVLDSGFRPDFIVGIWRGGTPVGIAVQELLDHFDVKTDHISIRTSLYSGIEEREATIRVHGMQYLVDNIEADHGLLIVDDVFDTGLSIEAVIEHLRVKARRNTPRDIRVATAYFKPSNNKTDRVPDYFVHETDQWLVFPHELRGLTAEEIREHKLGVESFSDRL
ncbi:MAG: hypoxanthine phosphoribosyltransferase [Planctomycetes bacterium]|nr:hypoxanthine phosphoribosyltransferase [Planctomycetota bacterium]